MTDFFPVRWALRVRADEDLAVKKHLYKNTKYVSKSHFIRCAVLRLIRLEEEEARQAEAQERRLPEPLLSSREELRRA